MAPIKICLNWIKLTVMKENRIKSQLRRMARKTFITNSTVKLGPSGEQILMVDQAYL